MKTIVFLIAIICIGCEPFEKKVDGVTPPYFDLAGFTNDILKRQVDVNTKATKTTFVGDQSETQNIEVTDSAFWAIELSSLLTTNLNNPSLKDTYTVRKGLTDRNSNLLITTYSILTEVNSNLKKLEMKYLGNPNEIRELIATFETNNSVYSTQQSVQLWMNNYGNKLLIDSMLVKGYNKTILLDTMYYQSKVEVVN